MKLLLVLVCLSAAVAAPVKAEDIEAQVKQTRKALEDLDAARATLEAQLQKLKAEAAAVDELVQGNGGGTPPKAGTTPPPVPAPPALTPPQLAAQLVSGIEALLRETTDAPTVARLRSLAATARLLQARVLQGACFPPGPAMKGRLQQQHR